MNSLDPCQPSTGAPPPRWRPTQRRTTPTPRRRARRPTTLHGGAVWCSSHRPAALHRCCTRCSTRCTSCTRRRAAGERTDRGLNEPRRAARTSRTRSGARLSSLYQCPSSRPQARDRFEEADVLRLVTLSARLAGRLPAMPRTRPRRVRDASTGEARGPSRRVEWLGPVPPARQAVAAAALRAQAGAGAPPLPARRPRRQPVAPAAAAHPQVRRNRAGRRGAAAGAAGRRRGGGGQAARSAARGVLRGARILAAAAAADERRAAAGPAGGSRGRVAGPAARTK